MVIWTEIGLLGGCTLLMVNAAFARPSVALLYVAAALMSALNGLQRPSLDALTPRLVPRDEIPAAAALSSLRGSVGMIAGPALGGLLLAVRAAEKPWKLAPGRVREGGHVRTQ